MTFTRAPSQYSDMTQDEVNDLVNCFTKPNFEDSEGEFGLEDGEYDDRFGENLYEDNANGEIDGEDGQFVEKRRKKRQLNDQGVKREEREDPQNLDYVNEGYLNDIQDQGICGSCWR